MRSDLFDGFQSFCWVVSSFLELLTVSTYGWAFKYFVGYRKRRIPLGLQEGEISQNHFCWHSLIAEDRVLLLRPLSNSIVGTQYFLWLLQLRWASKIYYSFWTSLSWMDKVQVNCGNYQMTDVHKNMKMSASWRAQCPHLFWQQRREGQVNPSGERSSTSHPLAWASQKKHFPQGNGTVWWQQGVCYFTERKQTTWNLSGRGE